MNANSLTQPVKARMEQALQEAFAPVYLHVIDESHLHSSSHANAQTHFQICVVSDAFEGKTRLACHRLVQELLSQELSGIKAFSLYTWTPQAWAAQGQDPGRIASPHCAGASKRT